MRTTLTLKDRSVALLLVDLQEEQRRDPQYKASGIDEILGNAARLLEAARATSRLIVHAAYLRDFTKRPPRPFEPTSSGGRPTFSDISSPMTAICREVAPEDGEHVIYKNDASAFCEGDLAPLLKQHGIDWLVVSGVWTEARDAMAAGLRVLLVKDACGSGTQAMHKTAVLNLANRLYGGAVTDTARAVGLLQGEAAQAWVAERPVPILFNFTNAAEHYAEL
jgi:nicotinamidase-related amidase